MHDGACPVSSTEHCPHTASPIGDAATSIRHFGNNITHGDSPGNRDANSSGTVSTPVGAVSLLHSKEEAT